jgi:MICOS complex subunit MIC26
MTRLLRLEHSFTSTIASLAPPKETNERLMPNSLYVLVAAMAGSIVVRNRSILLRATFPPLVGITAAYAVLPHTMHNVGDLVWSYEKRFPVLADTHIRVKERVGRFVETGIAHTHMSYDMAENAVGDARKSVEDWVRKGK